MSAEQWAGIQRGDESYAGSPSWYRFLEAVQELFAFRHVIPTTRSGSREVLFSVVAGPARSSPTTPLRHHPRQRRVHRRRGVGPAHSPRDGSPRPSTFKGNMETEALDALIRERGRDAIPVVFVTVTNNSGGGQTVSMANCGPSARCATDTTCRSSLDGCRFAENAWFIRTRKRATRKRPSRHRAGDGVTGRWMTMSAKKEAWPTWAAGWP